MNSPNNTIVKSKANTFNTFNLHISLLLTTISLKFPFSSNSKIQVLSLQTWMEATKSKALLFFTFKGLRFIRTICQNKVINNHNSLTIIFLIIRLLERNHILSQSVALCLDMPFMGLEKHVIVIWELIHMPENVRIVIVRSKKIKTHRFWLLDVDERLSLYNRDVCSSSIVIIAPFTLKTCSS